MITIFCGTNRPGSYSSKVAKFYSKQLTDKGIEHNYFTLEDMPQDLLKNDMYDGNRSEAMLAIQEKFLQPASKFVFVYPEYNGSFPGVLKAFIDASDIKKCWHNKKACLVGVSAGRAGNLRGMEHFTNILNHIRINVLHLKIPMSGIENVVDDTGNIAVPETISLIHQQIELFQEF
ncbi:MAG: NAD(P)H-dependent oxidoreductase [Bacteroidetes bacterium]|nr:NAD(P)H-dependent oxidoreductase [Bacteroidota bacterium]